MGAAEDGVRKLIRTRDANDVNGTNDRPCGRLNAASDL
jgi:hypothetical protein